MVFCPKCGSENTADAIFCINCGVKIVLTQSPPATNTLNPPLVPQPLGVQPPVVQQQTQNSNIINKQKLSLGIIIYIIGGFLTILPLLPVLEQIFPLMSGSESLTSTISGTTFVENATFTASILRGFTITVTGISSISLTIAFNSWTLIPLPGIVWFLILVGLSVLMIFFVLNIVKPFLTIYKRLNFNIITGLGIITGLIVLAFVAILFVSTASITNGLTINTMGFKNLTSANGITNIGLGTYILVISGILDIIGTFVLVYEKNTVIH